MINKKLLKNTAMTLAFCSFASFTAPANNTYAAGFLRKRIHLTDMSDDEIEHYLNISQNEFSKLDRNLQNEINEAHAIINRHKIFQELENADDDDIELMDRISAAAACAMPTSFESLVKSLGKLIASSFVLRNSFGTIEKIQDLFTSFYGNINNFF